MAVSRRFVAYYRVSTQQQGRSGLGLAAQQEAVQKHVASVAGEMVEAFEEVETGKLNARPALAQATGCLPRPQLPALMLALQSPMVAHLSHSSNVTSWIETAKGWAMVTWCCGCSRFPGP